MPKFFNKTFLQLLASASLLALGSCDIDNFRGFPSDKPPIHLVQDMDFQPKLRAQSAHEFDGWSDSRGARRPVADSFGNQLVVARGSLPNTALANKDANGQYVTSNPLALEHKFMVRGKPMTTIDRGREVYEIYCSMCHGYTGQGGNGKNGHGIVGRKWQPAPPNFHYDSKQGADNRVPNMPDGEYFQVITMGKGTMPAYGARMSVEDRWAIVHYVRALQSLSR
ncbi:MAG: cytochrome c [Planctomycetota bacterium]